MKGGMGVVAYAMDRISVALNHILVFRITGSYRLQSIDNVSIRQYDHTEI